MTVTAVTRENGRDGRNARLKGLLPQSLSSGWYPAAKRCSIWGQKRSFKEADF